MCGADREFPVGQECESDTDCLSDLGVRVAGGKCGADGTCECTLCKAGAGCKVRSNSDGGMRCDHALVA